MISDYKAIGKALTDCMYNLIITQYHSFEAPQGTSDMEAGVSPLPVYGEGQQLTFRQQNGPAKRKDHQY